jgi:hypothetical protein
LDNLARIEKIVLQAANLPRIDPPPEGWNPTFEELTTGYARLAMAYATSTALLQQALPIIVEELRSVQTEMAMRKRAGRR